MKESDNEIGKNILRILSKRGITVLDLANLAGVTRAAAAKWIYTNDLRVSTVERIAAALGVDPWELLKPVDDDNNEQNKLPQIICPHCGKAITISVKEN